MFDNWRIEEAEAYRQSFLNKQEQDEEKQEVSKEEIKRLNEKYEKLYKIKLRWKYAKDAEWIRWKIGESV